ncbi:MAG: hypothetical protein LBK97_06000 [Prevotellaceae bacterium]|jgi:hypothetical protein|nr:hypothetical protein [Prevotellaceae bacterium]
MKTKLQKLNTKIQKLKERERVKSREFIERELTKLVEQFPEIRVRYEHNDNDYFIEITKGEIYFQNDEYHKWDMNMWNGFVKQFPTQGLCIVSETDLFPFENVDFTLYGKNRPPTIN